MWGCGGKGVILLRSLFDFVVKVISLFFSLSAGYMALECVDTFEEIAKSIVLTPHLLFNNLHKRLRLNYTPKLQIKS